MSAYKNLSTKIKNMAATPSSRKDYKCSVCDKVTRYDNLKTHYINSVEFDKNDQPLNPKSVIFQTLTAKKQEHTKYFYENNYNRNKLPPFKSVASATLPLNPFTASVSKKRKANEGENKEKINEDMVDVHTDLNSSPCEKEVPVLQTECDALTTDFHNDIHDVDKPSSSNEFDYKTLAGLVSDELKGRLMLESTDIDQLSELIADKIINRKNDTDDKEVERSDVWIETDDEWICRECLEISDRDDVPATLKSLKRGTFGKIKKDAHQRNINRSMKNHLSSELHKWCSDYKCKMKKESLDAESVSKKACELLVTNAVLCFKTCGSSNDWVRLNDKDNLTEDLSPATVNDGKQEFFSLREICFSKLTKILQEQFKSSVNSFSVTLDKVTLNHISYSVICSYFFHEGAIYVVLNDIHKMQINEYDSEGTAKMVGVTLMDTLGISKNILAVKCHHFAYDGVYATNEERQGGGGLALKDHFADFVGVDRGDITGSHDMSHNMQLAYDDVFKKDTTVERITKEVYTIMDDFRVGKAGTIFKQVADDMGHSVLTNKGRQQTRFVRSDLRGFQTYLRNIPTLYAIHGKDVEDCIKVSDNTNAQIAMKTQRKLSDGSMIAEVAGYCMLLELYSLTSLESQHSKKLSTTTLESLSSTQEKLMNLGTKWEWDTGALRLAGIGSPHEIIESLKSGTYKPFVSEGSFLYNKRNLSISNTYTSQKRDSLLECGMDETDVDDHLNWSHLILHNAETPYAGEIAVEGFNDEKLKIIEKRLQKLAKDLNSRLDVRIHIYPLMTAAVNAFCAKFDWVDVDDAALREIAVDLLKALINNIKGPQKDNFSVDACCMPYIVFAKFIRVLLERSGNTFSLETSWIAFWGKYSNDPDFF